jgi:hypothetical protein
VSSARSRDHANGADERTTTAAKDGKLKLHKAKQNTNGSFSIGKTWALEELRTVEVSKVSSEHEWGSTPGLVYGMV